MKLSVLFLMGTVILSLGFFSVTTNTAEAFGVSPPYINAHKLVPGSRYESLIYLVQGSPKEDIRVKAEFEVPDEIRDWISIDQEETFTIPGGVQQFPLKVLIEVPQDASLGAYSGILRVKTLPVQQEGDQITVAVGGRIEMNITVGNDVIKEYSIRKIDILDIREGELPQALITIENTGNVPAKLDRATLDLFDKFGDIRIGFAQIENFENVPPFETKTIIAKFPIRLGLGVGEYWGEVKAYREGQAIANLRTVFNVLEKKTPYILYGSIAVALLILLGASYLIRKKYLGKKVATYDENISPGTPPVPEDVVISGNEMEKS